MRRLALVNMSADYSDVVLANLYVYTRHEAEWVSAWKGFRVAR